MEKLFSNNLVSEYLGRVLDRMIAISRSKRYQSAAGILESLKNSAPAIIVDRSSALHQLTTVSEDVWRSINSPLTIEIPFQSFFWSDLGNLII